jgi:hypothetical protein
MSLPEGQFLAGILICRMRFAVHKTTIALISASHELMADSKI